jgi:RNase P/RNase MRP subunit p29
MIAKTSEDTQFTLSLKEYLDDKFKVVSDRINTLVGSIDALVKETNNTKARIDKAEQDIIDIRKENETFRGVFRTHMKVIAGAFLLGSFIWIKEAREFILSVLKSHIGF